MNNNQLDLSIVISLFNEEESLRELAKWIEDVMVKEGYAYEIIMVDDGSRDNSWKVVRELAEKNKSIAEKDKVIASLMAEIEQLKAGK